MLKEIFSGSDIVRKLLFRQEMEKQEIVRKMKAGKKNMKMTHEANCLCVAQVLAIQ